MEMLLMGACLSLFGLAVMCLAFGAATRETGSTAAPAEAVEKPALKMAIAKNHFFADPPAQPIAARSPVPIEALLLQIESHVRLEQAAAESFLASPTSSLLHSRTASPFVN